MTTVPPSCCKHDVRFKVPALTILTTCSGLRGKNKTILVDSTGYSEEWILLNVCVAYSPAYFRAIHIHTIMDRYRWFRRRGHIHRCAHEFPVIVMFSISSQGPLIGVPFCLSSLMWWKDVVFLSIWNMFVGVFNAWMRKFAQVNGKGGSASGNFMHLSYHFKS